MIRLVALLSAVVLVAAACAASAGPTPTVGGFISVHDAWARPAAKGADSAAYLRITNGQLMDDTLVGASTPAAQAAQVHQTTTESGMTGMHPVDSLRIPSGKDVVFDPGGYHVMLIGLQQDLAVGDTFDLTLTFEQAGAVKVAVEVRGG